MIARKGLAANDFAVGWCHVDGDRVDRVLRKIQASMLIHGVRVNIACSEVESPDGPSYWT